VDTSVNDFTQTLDTNKLNEIRKSISSHKVVLSLPKFKIDYGVKQLKDSLRALGMKKPFNDSEADFSGISQDKNIYIDTVLHKAVVDVNEKGTEAAASTVVGMVSPAIASPDPIKYFTADHPFLCAIVEDDYGTILFMGKVNSPEYNEEDLGDDGLSKGLKNINVYLSFVMNTDGECFANVTLDLPSQGYVINSDGLVEKKFYNNPDGTSAANLKGNAVIVPPENPIPLPSPRYPWEPKPTIREKLTYNLGKLGMGNYMFTFSASGIQKTFRFSLPENGKWIDYTPKDDEFDLILEKDAHHLPHAHLMLQHCLSHHPDHLK
jgi:hypothetical protein